MKRPLIPRHALLVWLASTLLILQISFAENNINEHIECSSDIDCSVGALVDIDGTLGGFWLTHECKCGSNKLCVFIRRGLPVICTRSYPHLNAAGGAPLGPTSATGKIANGTTPVVQRLSNQIFPPSRSPIITRPPAPPPRTRSDGFASDADGGINAQGRFAPASYEEKLQRPTAVAVVGNSFVRDNVRIQNRLFTASPEKDAALDAARNTPRAQPQNEARKIFQDLSVTVSPTQRNTIIKTPQATIKQISQASTTRPSQSIVGPTQRANIPTPQTVLTQGIQTSISPIVQNVIDQASQANIDAMARGDVGPTTQAAFSQAFQASSSHQTTTIQKPEAFVPKDHMHQYYVGIPAKDALADDNRLRESAVQLNVTMQKLLSDLHNAHATLEQVPETEQKQAFTENDSFTSEQQLFTTVTATPSMVSETPLNSDFRSPATVTPASVHYSTTASPTSVRSVIIHEEVVPFNNREFVAITRAPETPSSFDAAPQFAPEGGASAPLLDRRQLLFVDADAPVLSLPKLDFLSTTDADVLSSGFDQNNDNTFSQLNNNNTRINKNISSSSSSNNNNNNVSNNKSNKVVASDCQLVDEESLATTGSFAISNITGAVSVQITSIPVTQFVEQNQENSNLEPLNKITIPEFTDDVEYWLELYNGSDGGKNEFDNVEPLKNYNEYRKSATFANENREPSSNETLNEGGTTDDFLEFRNVSESGDDTFFSTTAPFHDGFWTSKHTATPLIFADDLDQNDQHFLRTTSIDATSNEDFFAA